MTKKRLTSDEGNNLLVMMGYFYGWKKILDDFEISKEYGAKLKAGIFQNLLLKVLEAKKEIAQLQASVERMEAACRSGTIPVPAQGDTTHWPARDRLISEMQAFDGWVISLLESNISLLATVHNPETAGIRVNGLKPSFANLWALRLDGYKPMKRFPEQFDMKISLP